MANKVATVFGGSGFIGRYVVQELAKQGYTIRVAVRNPDQAWFLKPYAPIGLITPISVDITHEASVKQAIEGSDFVVNCVGILYEKGHQTFHNIHVKAAENLAKACKKAGIKRMVHVSAVGANEKSRSKYSRTKGLGEKAVLKNFPDATILRLNLVFGDEDKFFNLFAGLSLFTPVLPVFDGGKTKFQPVFVEDVGKAIVKVLNPGKAKNKFAGKTYELCGPDTYTYKELMALVFEFTGRDRFVLSVPSIVGKFMGTAMQCMPEPLLTRDQVELLKSDKVATKNAKTFDDLDMKPQSVRMIVPRYLRKYRHAG